MIVLVDVFSLVIWRLLGQFFEAFRIFRGFDRYMLILNSVMAEAIKSDSVERYKKIIQLNHSQIAGVSILRLIDLV